MLVGSGYDLVFVYSLGVFTNLLTILFLVLDRMSAARLKLWSGREMGKTLDYLLLATSWSAYLHFLEVVVMTVVLW